MDMTAPGYPLLEIGETEVPYIGTAYNTKKAIRSSRRDPEANTIMNAECYHCQSLLVCMLGMEYVVCSSCYTVSPVTYGHANEVLGFQPQGVGIGFLPGSGSRASAVSRAA